MKDIIKLSFALSLKKKIAENLDTLTMKTEIPKQLIRLLSSFTYCTILAVSNVINNSKFSVNPKNLQIKSVLFCDITVKSRKQSTENM